MHLPNKKEEENAVPIMILMQTVTIRPKLVKTDVRGKALTFA